MNSTTCSTFFRPKTYASSCYSRSYSWIQPNILPQLKFQTTNKTSWTLLKTSDSLSHSITWITKKKKYRRIPTFKLIDLTAEGLIHHCRPRAERCSFPAPPNHYFALFHNALAATTGTYLYLYRNARENATNYIQCSSEPAHIEQISAPLSSSSSSPPA